MQYIDDPIVFAGDFDPSPQGLPNDWINNFAQNTKSPDHTSFIRMQKLKNNKKPKYCKDPNLLIFLKELFSNEGDQVKIFEYFDTDHQKNESAVKFQNEKIIELYKYGSAECEMRKTSILAKEIPLCTWHYSLIERKYRYPFKRINAGTGRRCVFLKLPMPVLIKDKCQNDYYQWKSSMEEVPSSCACVV